MTALELINVTKQYTADSALAVDHISLTMNKGEILGLVGPSGCGKTSTLRLIAGFERPDSGTILINARAVTGTNWVSPEKRGVGMVFQDYALFPHLTVRQNVAFGLKGQSREKIKDTTEYLLRLIGLSDMAERYPHELSGGERQRVALARALAREPVLLLLDEPFSNLDADRRALVREQVRAILRSMNATAIFVTHDQEEALFMCDRIALLNKGRLEQLAAPESLFHQPASRFVAEFLGHTDFLPGEVQSEGVLTEIGLIPQRMALPLGAHVELVVRADDVTLAADRDSKSLILARHFKGAMNVYRVRLPSGRLLHSLQPHTLNLKPGTPVRVWYNAGHPLACFYNGEAARVEE
ncbi:MAG: ABC transporter ATP-binding protein [Chloroflexota bacterium]